MINIYDHGYKRFLFVPLALFVVFLFLVLVYPGVPRGIDLDGGTLIIVRADKPLDASKIEGVLKQKFDLEELMVTGISSPTGGYGITIQFARNNTLQSAQDNFNAARQLAESNPGDARARAAQSLGILSSLVEVKDFSSLAIEDLIEYNSDRLILATERFNEAMQSAIVSEFGLGDDARFQRREIGPTLGEKFWENAVYVTLVSLLLVTLVIFIFFRELIPSFAVIAAAIFDVFGALALMAVFNISLSLSSIPALLMLVGYSVDTDIMLTTRLLKRSEGNPRGRAKDAMTTGLTMTLTTLAAVSAMLVLSYFGQIIVIFEIAAVILFGLLADLISTWLMNAPVLLWYTEEKRGVRRR